MRGAFPDENPAARAGAKTCTKSSRAPYRRGGRKQSRHPCRAQPRNLIAWKHLYEVHFRTPRKTPAAKWQERLAATPAASSHLSQGVGTLTKRASAARTCWGKRNYGAYPPPRAPLTLRGVPPNRGTRGRYIMITSTFPTGKISLAVRQISLREQYHCGVARNRYAVKPRREGNRTAVGQHHRGAHNPASPSRGKNKSKKGRNTLCGTERNNFVR